MPNTAEPERSSARLGAVGVHHGADILISKCSCMTIGSNTLHRLPPMPSSSPFCRFSCMDLVVRPLLDEGLIELAVELRRGDGDVRLADDEAFPGAGGSFVGAARRGLTRWRSRPYAERHVRSRPARRASHCAGMDSGASYARLTPAGEPPRRHAAAETGLHWDALADEVFAPLLERSRCRCRALRRRDS